MKKKSITRLVFIVVFELLCIGCAVLSVERPMMLPWAIGFMAVVWALYNNNDIVNVNKKDNEDEYKAG